MDKLAKAAPSIRSFKVSAPIVFAPNVQVTHLKSWSDEFGYYRPMMDALLSQNNVNTVFFMPNVVSPMATIEDRAKMLAKNLSNKKKLFENQRVHLVTHSFAGVDARAAISLYGSDQYV